MSGMLITPLCASHVAFNKAVFSHPIASNTFRPTSTNCVWWSLIVNLMPRSRSFVRWRKRSITSAVTMWLHTTRSGPRMDANLCGGLNYVILMSGATFLICSRTDGGIRLASEPWSASTTISTAPSMNAALNSAEFVSNVSCPRMCNPPSPFDFFDSKYFAPSFLASSSVVNGNWLMKFCQCTWDWDTEVEAFLDPASLHYVSSYSPSGGRMVAWIFSRLKKFYALCLSSCFRGPYLSWGHTCPGPHRCPGWATFWMRVALEESRLLLVEITRFFTQSPDKRRYVRGGRERERKRVSVKPIEFCFKRNCIAK